MTVKAKMHVTSYTFSGDRDPSSERPPKKKRNFVRNISNSRREKLFVHE